MKTGEALGIIKKLHGVNFSLLQDDQIKIAGLDRLEQEMAGDIVYWARHYKTQIVRYLACQELKAGADIMKKVFPDAEVIEITDSRS